MKKIVLVFGPTGSGKSSFATERAFADGGEIINADSMQIYNGLPILTAQPTEQDKAKVPHKLYGFLDPTIDFSVASWIKCVKEELESVSKPYIVGGTGFYFKVLTEGLSPIPDISEEVRQKVRQMSLDEIKSHVTEFQFTDPQRLKRACEVELETGKPLSYFQKLPKIRPIEADFQAYFINPPRDVLYERIHQRFQKMLNSGVLKEVEEFMKLSVPKKCFLWHALGVCPLSSFLSGEITLDKAIEETLLETRHYAKRQVTFFKNQFHGDFITEIS